MNAAIRAVTRSCLEDGHTVSGVRRGFRGLIDGAFVPLGARDVGGIIHEGGTFLRSSRCPEFKSSEHRATALNQLRDRGVDALVVIGGNGSQAGSLAVHEMGYPVIGVASTIDNDLRGTEMTIGADTALNVALESVDRLRTTAVSHRRVVLVEVMGRGCGYLATMTAIAGGAEALVVPEEELHVDTLVDEIIAAHRRKDHALVIVAEGAPMNAMELARYFRRHPDLDFSIRVTVLGHVQRGGVPTAFDRLLGTRFGAKAAACISEEEFGVLVGLNRGRVTTTPLADVVGDIRHPDPGLTELAAVLSM